MGFSPTNSSSVSATLPQAQLRPIATNNYSVAAPMSDSTFSKWSSNHTYSTTVNIFPNTFNGAYYTCTTAGTSGATEPSWPAPSEGATVTDNTVTWTCHMFTGATYRASHVITSDCGDVRLLFANWQTFDSTPVPNAITVKASVEQGSATYLVTFNGQSTVTIAPGGTVVSDPLAINFAAGDTLFTRTYVSVASAGQKWQLPRYPSFGGNEGMLTGDQTTAGSFTNPSSSNGYGPVTVLSKTTNPGVLLVGDSIMTSTGDQQGLNATFPTAGGGVGIRYLRDSVGFIRISKSGELANDFVSVGNRFLRAAFAEYCTHAIVQYGINDLSSNNNYTLVQLQQNLKTIWNMFSNMGLKVYQTTITPHTTSSDSWATLANQTAYNASLGGTNSGTSLGTCIRTQLNDWIRTTPAPLAGYIEFADQVESSRNSGLWKVNGTGSWITGDGLHPNGTVAYPSVEAVFSPTQFGVSKYVRVADSFALSSLSTAPTGQTWSTPVGTWTANNQAYTSSAATDSVAVIDSSVADASIRLTIATTNGGHARLVFRYTDSNNYWAIQPDPSTGGYPYLIRKKVAGTWSTVYSSTTNTANGDVIRVVTQGPNVTLYVNGTFITTISDTFNQSATQHGMGIDNSTLVRLSNFSVWG